MDSSNPASLSSLTSSETSHIRACSSCSRAKAKCVPDQEQNGKCQRCQRLQKTCEPTTPQVRSQPRKRKPKTTHVPKSRVGKLEEKLDGLVSLIKSTQDLNSAQIMESIQQPLNSTTSNMRPSGSITQTVNSLTSSATALSDPQAPVARGTEISRNSPALLPFVPIRQLTSLAPNIWSNVQSSSDPILLNSFMPTFAEAEVLLNTFRDQVTPQFPFIIVPPSVSAEELYQQRPFLYITILSITSRDSIQQKELGKVVMKQLAERLFVNSERSLDLLLGVLTYAVWCYWNLLNIQQLTSLLSAAMTLVCDLGLSRPRPKKRSPVYEALRESCPVTLPTLSNAAGTLEEQRTFLGYYFLSSVISLFIRTRNFEPSQRHSPHVEDCLKALVERGDHPNDKLAIALIRLQPILERIHQSSWHAEPHEINTGTVFIISSIQQELKSYRKDLSLQQANDPIILLHYHITEISLYEAALCKSPGTTDPFPNFRRLELLCACLEATKSYFEVIFSIPAASWMSLSTPTSSHFKYALAALHSLSVFDHPEWNLEYVRETVDYKLVLCQVIERLETLSSLVGFEKLDMFSRLAKWMSRIKVYVEGKMAGPLQTVPDQMPDFAGTLGTEDLSDFFQFLDDAWMTDILDTSDYQANTVAEN